ncbi:MAG: exonuclease subunit SbcD, partial [Muribaculaceae bacterium]|nr:exonuclease subunit SbcD [Muribaculaceae bacterium]
MKILHTSDWHLGCQLYGFDRLEEQAAMLDTIIDIAGREKPDAFIVSGDVFDSTQPPNRAYRL